MLETVTVTRYVTALREGGVAAGTGGGRRRGELYVAKFTGAAQGRKALVAEVVAGELARRLGLPVPELLRIEGGPADRRRRARTAGAGPGEGLRRDQPRHGLRLPGCSAYFDPLVFPVDPLLAGRVLWFDALIG